MEGCFQVKILLKDILEVPALIPVQFPCIWPYKETPYAEFSQSGASTESSSVFVTSSAIVQMIKFSRESLENGYAGHGFGTGLLSVSLVIILIPFGNVFKYVGRFCCALGLPR